MHLVIDGFGGNTSKMWDDGLVRQFLTDYPEALEMTRITEPRVLVYDAPKPEDSGVSGFVIIAESHISIHTFPRKNYVNIDIFSCRPFDHDLALADAKKLFDLEDAQTWLLDRGLEWLDERQGLMEAQAQRAALETETEGAHEGRLYPMGVNPRPNPLPEGEGNIAAETRRA